MIRGSCLCGAARFEYARSFCATCGCPAPQKLPTGAAYWVPAGSLDDDPGVAIAGHIGVASKAPWDEIAGEAPRFAEGLPARK